MNIVPINEDDIIQIEIVGTGKRTNSSPDAEQ